MDPVPDLLTIEEAARVLRIGRTKAYAMGQEWRATNGQSGIKVQELGGQLRVPRVWLEDELDTPVLFIPEPPAGAKHTGRNPTPAPAAPPTEPAAEPAAPLPLPATPAQPPRRGRRTPTDRNQLSLPFG